MHTEILEGDFGLRDADAVRTRLLDALGEHAAIEVNSVGLTRIDLSILQILIAASRSAKDQRKTFRVRARTDGPVATAMSRLGLGAEGHGAPFEIQWD